LTHERNEKGKEKKGKERKRKEKKGKERKRKEKKGKSRIHASFSEIM